MTGLVFYDNCTKDMKNFSRGSGSLAFNGLDPLEALWLPHGGISWLRTKRGEHFTGVHELWPPQTSVR